MHNLDYIVIILFSVLIVMAGLSFRHSGSDMKSYFAAGGAVPWSISGLSLFMSFFSAGTFVVWGSIAYEYGLVAIVIQLTMAAAGFLVGGIIAPRWRKTGVLTVAEFIRLRLGDRIQQFYTYLILLLSLAYTGAFLYPVAKIVNVSTGFSINACIVLLGVLILIYTAVGGLWAVIITDVLQFVILTAAVLIVVPLAIKMADGLPRFLEQAPETFFSLTNGEYTFGFILAFMIYNTIFIGGNWAYVQRYTSVKNERSARKVGYLFGGLYLISPLIWMLPPMLYRVINPELSGLENEGAYLLICKAVLPVGMLGLMLGGMIFATASSVNTTLNLSAAVLTNDLYKIFRPNASNAQTMKVARWSTILFGLGTIGVALLVPAAGGIVEVVLSVGAVTGCSLYGPPIWAMFSKRHTGRSILACTLIALGINVFFKFITPYTIGLSLDRAQEMLAGALIPFILLAGYELWAYSRGQISADYLAFANRKKTVTTAAEEAASGQQNKYGLKVLAVMLGLIGLLIMGLGAIATDARWLVMLMGACLLALSVWMHPNTLQRK
ncbi:sodium:solute symporter family protein [Flavilitoribacter nigricans]|uniref:Sodium transporter n=1 Tax=Flavilitoribacter nigricans (strain ATCC 23147 / DSM 23189 / NBRC 102662 / NCIMB 1420 / SS-2) TaxID=1122177 RepID=A0A2D0NIA0_FLAN2|nr:sodium:solute symporter family protein [Flavilitoribacter nigricans]PHN08177.1 sodium transporter [Flavilitoribacter nigricans DSM 23189 = NBRC 102662]